MVDKFNYRRWGIIILLLTIMSLPFFTLAVDTVGLPGGPSGPPSSLAPDVSENLIPPCDTDCGYNDLLLLIKNVFDFLTVKIAVPLAAATIVIGGAIMMMAGSNSGKREQAKKIIWAAVWGLVIVMTSFLIVKLVFQTLVKTEEIPPDFKEIRNN